MKSEIGWKRGRILAGLALSLSTGGWATSIAEMPAEDQIRESEVIVVGTLQQVKEEAMARGGESEREIYGRGTLAVHQVLKGSPRTPVELRIFRREVPKEPLKDGGVAFIPGMTGWFGQLHQEGQRGLWFLKWDDSHRCYMPLSPHYGFQPEKDLDLYLGLTKATPAVPGPPGTQGLPRDLGFVWKPDPTRLIVASVRPSSPAAEGKFQMEDVVQAVEKRNVSTPQGFEEVMAQYLAGATVNVNVQREMIRGCPSACGKQHVHQYRELTLKLVVTGTGRGATAPPDGSGQPVPGSRALPIAYQPNSSTSRSPALPDRLAKTINALEWLAEGRSWEDMPKDFKGEFNYSGFHWNFVKRGGSSAADAAKKMLESLRLDEAVFTHDTREGFGRWLADRHGTGADLRTLMDPDTGKTWVASPSTVKLEVESAAGQISFLRKEPAWKVMAVSPEGVRTQVHPSGWGSAGSGGVTVTTGKAIRFDTLDEAGYLRLRQAVLGKGGSNFDRLGEIMSQE